MQRAVAVLLLSLGGCGADLVRLDSARALDVQGERVAVQVAAYLSLLHERRRAANVALAASDPSCRWGKVVYVKAEAYPPDPGDVRPLCPTDPAEGHLPVQLNPPAIGPLPAQLAALALYEKALAEIVGRDPASAQSSVAAATTALVTASGRGT